MYLQDIFTIPANLAGLPACRYHVANIMDCLLYAISWQFTEEAKLLNSLIPFNLIQTGIKKCLIFDMSVNLDNWEAVSGLEIHVQLSTKSKLFSGASTDLHYPILSL